MMQMYGYTVIEYSNEGSESSADEHVIMLNEQEYNELYGNRSSTSFYGNDATIGSRGHQRFEEKLIPALRKRLQPQDIICHPFGHAHQVLMDIFPEYQHVETGIGYPTLMPNSFRIFESYAWMHYHQGKEGRNGKNYEWVVPNYYDLDDWDINSQGGDYLAFLGRITELKGMDTIKALADYSPYPIVLHGQGDPTPWSHPNIDYRGPLAGRQRSQFLGGAKALLAPTVFTEPFCGMAVEAMLCGTPVLSVDYGAMTETVQEGMGYRCHTLNDWVEAIENLELLDRNWIAKQAKQRYSLEACGKKYDKVFCQLNDLYRNGWYELKRINYIQLHREEQPFAQRLAQWIQGEINPSSVLDIGCGPGTYVQELINLDIDAIGIDIDKRLKDNKAVVIEDLFESSRSADLVICLEVAEHIEAVYADKIAMKLAECTNDSGRLIFSAAQPGQGGIGHINCQDKQYWKTKFESQRLNYLEKETNDLIKEMQNGYHMGWFVQNAMVFRKV